MIKKIRMVNGLNLHTVNLTIEIAAAFGLLTLSVVALIYISCTKNRVQDCTQAVIFISLIIS